MNDRERFLAVAQFDKPDYVPLLSCCSIDGPVPETVDLWRREQGAPIRIETDEALGPEWTTLLGTTAALQLGWDRYWGLTRVHSWGPASRVPAPRAELLADDGEYLTFRYEDGRIEREMVRNAERYGMPEFIRYPLTTPEDWPAYRERWLPLEDGVYPEDWAGLAQRWRERDFPLAAGLPGTFGVLRGLFGTAQAAMLFYDAPAVVHDILRHYRRRAMHMMERFMREAQPDMVGIGEDFCYRSGCFVSPAMFREFLAPHYRELVDYAHSFGVRLILVDSDGLVEGVIPLLEEAGVNCLQAFEPRAGNDVVRVRQRHPRFVIWGGLDKYVMDQSDPAVIDAEVERKVPPLLQHGGYFPGIDHGLPPTALYRSYLHLMRRLHELTGNPQGEFWQYL